MDKTRIMKEIEGNYAQFIDADKFPIDEDRIIRCLKNIRALLFPDYFAHEDGLLDLIVDDLTAEIKKTNVDYEKIVGEFVEKLPRIQNFIYKDAEAIYNGDPSAKTYSEIIQSFPGFIAILAYRVAHELYDLNVPIIPRLIAEYAHDKTGIDINPGAQIGEYFCIDHGTGIVIGETAVVGDHVRLYHGVTLGVRNFKKDEMGNLMKGGKRHPNIGNHVIIYANATILGGDTYISDNSVIPTGSLIIQTPETFTL